MATVTNWSNLRPPPLSVFLATLLSSFFCRIQTHSLLQTQPSHLFRYRQEPVYHQKAINPQCPNKPELPFSCKNKPQAYFAIKTEYFNQFKQEPYLSASSNINILRIIFNLSQLPNIKILFKSDFPSNALLN